MQRDLFSALYDVEGGRDLLWASWAREREVWAREREMLVDALTREREALTREREALTREREASTREREAWARERELLLEREAFSIAELQKEVDFSNGLVTVRSALEGIVTTTFPDRSVTEALRRFCADVRFQEYLGTVSSAVGVSKDSLEKSALGAYGMLSAIIHAGSTHAASGSDVPQAVLRDKISLYAVAAIFKFARRDVRFYIGGPGGTLKLPSPPHSPPPATSSDAGSPPKATLEALTATETAAAEGRSE